MPSRTPISLSILLSSAMLIGACGGADKTVQEGHRLHISTAEIEEHGVGVDAYTLVQRLRPAWLIKTGPHSGVGGDDIRVYVNGMRHDDPSALRFYSGSNIESVQFLEPGRATTRYGIGHSHGAIIVNVRGGGYATP
jgi:hypothetical protein